MKKYLLGLFAMAMAIGFSAFSPEAHKAKNGLTTYYAIKTSSTHWRWDISVPIGFECLPETGGPTCTTVADSQPGDDTAPSGTSNQLYKQ